MRRRSAPAPTSTAFGVAPSADVPAPTAPLLRSGRRRIELPHVDPRPWIEAVPAVVQAWYSGMEGGHALADLVLGRTEPTGRLPFTVPTDEAHLPDFDPDATEATYDAWHGYRMLARDHRNARFPFGFGLSYTSLAIEEVSCRQEGADLIVTARVANEGTRPGVEVVQAYDCGAAINPDNVCSQVEGAIIQGLGGALFESMQFANGRILNASFAGYRVPRFGDMPEIRTILIDRKDVPPIGAGETPIIAVAPAIGNAIFHATGVRLRALPLARAGRQ